MRIFTELEPKTYEDIQGLVNEGKYESIDQFLRVAAQNQLAIERSENGTETESPQGSHFNWGYSPPADIPTGSPFTHGRDELLLFSQYYRFLPLKCALYKIGELTAEKGGAVSIEEARTYVAEEIWPIRNQIAEWEEKNDIKKKDRKSTGFPKDKDGSMKRYLDHYVGKVQTQKGEPAGFGHDLGYVSFQEDGMDWNVKLTLTGARFVQITNPLLNTGPNAPTLSDEEQAFVVTTIRNELTEEYRFTKFIYNVLEKGQQESYTNYMDEYRDFLEDSPAISGEPSDNSVRSHAAGAISRMVELGILERGRRRGWYNPRRHPDEYESVSIEA